MMPIADHSPRGRRAPRREIRSITPVRDIPIRDDTIRLGQLLKLAGLVDSGAEAKNLLATGGVSVNGEPVPQRGRQLHRGDIVAVAGEHLRVA